MQERIVALWSTAIPRAEVKSVKNALRTLLEGNSSSAGTGGQLGSRRSSLASADSNGNLLSSSRMSE